jgi:hypothetical protein
VALYSSTPMQRPVSNEVDSLDQSSTSIPVQTDQPAARDPFVEPTLVKRGSIATTTKQEFSEIFFPFNPELP